MAFAEKNGAYNPIWFCNVIKLKKYGYVFWDFYEKISAFIWSQILYNAYSFDYFLCKHSKTHFRFAKGENELDESQLRILSFETHSKIPNFNLLLL